jgi:hypothetical protein
MSWPVSFRDRPAKIVRSIGLDGRLLGYTTEDGGRTGRSSLQFLAVDKVPAFEDYAAFFAVERVRGGSRIVRVLHRVETPPGETTEAPPPRPPAPGASVPPSRHRP